ncbi:MAG TPA: asparaginase [Gemmatimonadales bacterium]|nr:asparaginase [Gemmatimonadales bacterium]
MIHLLFTGGTISMTRDERAGGNVPTHGGAALVALAPDLPAISPYRIDDWGRYPACHMGPAKLWELRNRVRSVMQGDAGEPPRGIVITHGTDTIEETAYLLARTLPPDIPVVITGAMRTSSDEGWDGPRNLTDAVRVAAAPSSRGRGTMVVFAGQVLAGATACKVEATALEAFEAPHAGPVGIVAGDTLEWIDRAPDGIVAPRQLDPAGLTARVAHIPMILGDLGELLDLARKGFDGVVIEAFGSGNVPPGALPAIRRWIAEGKPVVLASRCARGEVQPVYAFPGGGATLVREGVIPAGPRTPSQARMELALALSAGREYGQ